MKSDAERGPIGAWAYRERKRRRWSVEQAVTELEALTGTGLRPVSLRGIEAGPKPPGEEVVRGLERLYGSKAPEPKAPITMADLVAALHANTDAMREIVSFLRATALAGVAEGQARYEAELRDRSAGEEPGESPGPPPPADRP